MSKENVEMVRRVYEAASQRDWESALRDAHPDLVLTFQVGPQAGTHRGREAAIGVASDITAGFDAWVLEPLQFFEREDQVVAIVRNRLRPKGGTGGEFEYRNGHIWTFRDGRVTSLVGYPNPEEALEAAGLSE